MGFLSGFEHIVRDSEPLAPHTWFRLGGPADYFAEPTSTDELAALVRRCHEENMPVRVLGSGSNVLVRDEGVRGLVLSLTAAAFSEISAKGPIVSAGCGAKLGHVVSTAVREGLAGLEPLVGIPGTVGGALHGNSGSAGADVGQWTHSATVMTRSGEMVVRSREELRFSYRQSSLDEPVILGAEFTLEEDDPRELTKRMQKAWIVKRAHQPQGNLNAGCIFKDVGGLDAGQLIEQAGLKSARTGEVMVCADNPNFIAASTGATCADVVKLIELLKKGVDETLGVELETQIEIW
ncbi:MAG: UDP-N-acetylmuramate dehydrogenase [Pirellulaceae bacterium]